MSALGCHSCGPGGNYSISDPIVSDDGTTATIAVHMSSGGVSTDTSVTTAIVNGAPRIVAFDLTHSLSPIEDVRPAVEAYMTAISNGDWSTAATMLTVDQTPLTERSDLAPLYTTGIARQVGPDGTIA